MRSSVWFGITQGHSQRCYYDLAHGIEVTASLRLEVIAVMTLQ